MDLIPIRLAERFAIACCIALLPCCATSPPVNGEGEAAQSLEALIANGTAETLYAEANGFFDRGAYGTAFRLYQATLERDSSHLGALTNAGVCARRLGDIATAIEWYDRALLTEPRDETALQNRIVAGTMAGLVRESIPFAERLCEVNPDDAENWAQLGELYLLLARYGDAAEAYRNSLALDAGNAAVLYNAGLAFAASDAIPESLDALSKALELDPLLGAAYSPLVKLLLAAEDYDTAWEVVARGQTAGAQFEPEVLFELRKRSGRAGPE